MELLVTSVISQFLIIIHTLHQITNLEIYYIHTHMVEYYSAMKKEILPVQQHGWT